MRAARGPKLKQWNATRGLLPAMAGLLLCAFTSCSHHNCDLVEADLRSKEERLYQLQDELQRAKCYNQALQQELTVLRQSPACKLTPELASQIYTIREVVLGRQTGGIDDDDCPGDEALQVVVEPRDADGQDIKAPGSLLVTALQITPQGFKTPLSSWEVGPAELRSTWRSGLFGSGYYLVFPWKIWPSSPRLRVVVHFKLADGRMFEAERDVIVHLTPQQYRKPGVPVAPPVAPEVIEPTPLTPPHAAEPGPDLGLERPSVKDYVPVDIFRPAVLQEPRTK